MCVLGETECTSTAGDGICPEQQSESQRSHRPQTARAHAAWSF